MSPIALQRVVEGFGGGLCVLDSRHRDPTNGRGRQGKRPALRAAYVVGWIREFVNILDTPCWRSPQFSERNQSSKRRRSPSQGDFGP